jgi:SAM-dependent methyltransferase
MRFDDQLSAKVFKRFGQLARLGPLGLARTAYSQVLGPAAYALTDPARNLARTLHGRKSLSRSLDERVEHLKQRAISELRPEAAPMLREIDVDADKRIAPERRPGLASVIGPIGRRGELLSRIGAIDGIRCASKDDFAARRGPPTDLVDVDGRLGIRRVYGTERGRFVQVLEAMLDLAKAGCPVPRVIAIDWNSSAITSEYVRGLPLRAGGAKPELIAKLEEGLLAIHRAGYVLGNVDEDVLIFEADDDIVVVDLDHAVPLADLSRDMSIYLRDIDRRKFNKLFGTRLMTAKSLRRLGSPPSADKASIDTREVRQVYAPIFIRDDIHWGKLWNPDVGIGRWNYILKDHLPIPKGGNVLDLGSNNGFNPLQMLRFGASSAVGVEIDEGAIRQGEFLKSAYEWLDNRKYDFRYIHGSQGELESYGLKHFDMVTAFCSLYYLSEEEMRATIRFIRKLTNVLVLQCNIDRLIDRSSEETFKKASVEFALELLEEAGFEKRRVVAPPGYSRPLIIALAP